jgi:hypothetical protein
MGSDEGLGIETQRLCAGDRVGFVLQDEIEHGGQDFGFAKAGAQFVGRDAGEREQAVGVGFIAQHPAERGQGQGLGIERIFLFAKNLPDPFGCA